MGHFFYVPAWAGDQAREWEEQQTAFVLKLLDEPSETLWRIGASAILFMVHTKRPFVERYYPGSGSRFNARLGVEGGQVCWEGQVSPDVGSLTGLGRLSLKYVEELPPMGAVVNAFLGQR